MSTSSTTQRVRSTSTRRNCPVVRAYEPVLSSPALYGLCSSAVAGGSPSGISQELCDLANVALGQSGGNCLGDQSPTCLALVHSGAHLLREVVDEF